MGYRYAMLPFPISTTITDDKNIGKATADALQEFVNEQAKSGWEFWRVDHFAQDVQPGCLGALTGVKQGRREFYIVTFRFPTQGQGW